MYFHQLADKSPNLCPRCASSVVYVSSKQLADVIDEISIDKDLQCGPAVILLFGPCQQQGRIGARSSKSLVPSLESLSNNGWHLKRLFSISRGEDHPLSRVDWGKNTVISDGKSV